MTEPDTTQGADTTSSMSRIESKTNLVDIVYEKLRTAIVVGELGSGEPFSDAAVGDQLGVSRTPVREAVHRLVAAGLVESRGRSGWRVTTFGATDVRELFQARRILEPAGLDALAREYASKENRAEAEAQIELLTTVFEDYEGHIVRERYGDYFDADHYFHSLVVGCLRNGRVDDMYRQMSNHINRGRHFLTYHTAGRADATLGEHQAVSDAIKQARFDEARDALIYHLTVGEELMLAQLERMREPS